MIAKLASIAAMATTAQSPCVAAPEYACQAERFCACSSAEGCSGGDIYLRQAPRQACREDARHFHLSLFRRRVELSGDGLRVALREARPYFSDVDWYHSGQTDVRGVLNLSFDNEAPLAPVVLREMVRGDVDRHLWSLSGTCEVMA